MPHMSPAIGKWLMALTDVAFLNTGDIHLDMGPAPDSITSNLGGTFTVLNSNVATTSYTDSTVTSVNAYLYRVRTADAVGNLSAPSGIDVATAITFTDNPLTVGATPVKEVHLTELRQAVNAVRAAANLGAATWTDPTLTGRTGAPPTRNAVRRALSRFSVVAATTSDAILFSTKKSA